MSTSLMMRSSHVVVDELGMDPLRDKSFEHIKQQILTWTPYIVSDSDKYNAPLISYNVYETPDLWWVILAYNDILDVFTLVPGMQLRIPNQNEVWSALATEQERQPSYRTVNL